MEEKFIDKKKEAESKINNILESFKKDTGVSIHYVNFKTESYTGFNHTKEKCKTNIIIKND